jgi:hypothetical protein
MSYTNKYTPCINRHVHKYINSLKYSYIPIYDGHGLIMMYDIHMHLNDSNTITNDGLEYIAAIFNINTHKIIHNLCVYKNHSCLVFTF